MSSKRNGNGNGKEEPFDPFASIDANFAKFIPSEEEDESTKTETGHSEPDETEAGTSRTFCNTDSSLSDSSNESGKETESMNSSPVVKRAKNEKAIKKQPKTFPNAPRLCDKIKIALAECYGPEAVEKYKEDRCLQETVSDSRKRYTEKLEEEIKKRDNAISELYASLRAIQRGVSSEMAKYEVINETDENGNTETETVFGEQKAERNAENVGSGRKRKEKGEPKERGARRPRPTNQNKRPNPTLTQIVEPGKGRSITTETVTDTTKKERKKGDGPDLSIHFDYGIETPFRSSQSIPAGKVVQRRCTWKTKLNDGSFIRCPYQDDCHHIKRHWVNFHKHEPVVPLWTYHFASRQEDNHCRRLWGAVKGQLAIEEEDGASIEEDENE